MNGRPYIGVFFCVCDPHSRGEDLVTYTSPLLLTELLADRPTDYNRTSGYYNTNTIHMQPT